MSAPWPMTPLGELVTSVNRVVVPIPGQTYRQLGVRLWGQGAYERESIDGGLTKYQQLFRAECGDIVVNKIWARNGSVAVVDQVVSGCYGSNEFPMFAPKPDRLDPRWMHWITKTRDFWKQCDQKSRGTSGQNRIRPERFLEIKIPLPPLDDQLRIIARLEELNSKVIEARGLHTSSVQEIEALVVSTHIALSEANEEPLSSYIDLDEDSVLIEPGVPYPQVGVRGFGGGLFSKPPVYGGQTTYKTFNRLYEGALVLSQVKGWEGAVAIAPASLAGCFVSPEYRTFRPKPDRVLPEYLATIVPTQFFWGRLKDATRGVGARRERTRPEQFLELKFKMPSLPNQQRALIAFRKIEKVRQLQYETAAELDAMTPSILDRAFQDEL